MPALRCMITAVAHTRDHLYPYIGVKGFAGVDIVFSFWITAFAMSFPGHTLSVSKPTAFSPGRMFELPKDPSLKLLLKPSCLLFLLIMHLCKFMPGKMLIWQAQ